MDPEIFADFIVEAKEHLETIEPNLLELEKAPDNLSILNEIFRPMHSLKGASGFLGLNKINGLAHRAENVMDELRKGTMTTSTVIMDVILEATDALRRMIENLETIGNEGDVETEGTIVKLDAIMAGTYSADDADGSSADVINDVSDDIVEVSATSPTVIVESSSADSADSSIAADTVGVSSREWIATLAPLNTYALNSFGEGHLKDFIDEAKENVENLATGLLSLEKNPTDHSELVNDLFRFFHNLKGNSGIVGYNELNSVTHEAETLLNMVRHDEIPVSKNLVDLLLLVVDVIDELIVRIDPTSGQVHPVDVNTLLGRLQQANNGGAIEMPVGVGRVPVDSENTSTKDKKVDPKLSSEPVAPTIESDDLSVFIDTVKQQQASVNLALEELAKDSSQKEYIDGLFRSLVTIQNAANFMELEDIKTYAQRTSGIVDKARSTDMDFGMMVDLLKQECSIISDMVETAIKDLKKLASDKPAPAAPATETQKTDNVVKQSSEKVVQSASPVKSSPVSEVAKPASAPSSPQASAPKPQAPPTPPKPGAQPPTPAKKDDAVPKSSSTIRVDHEKLDHLMNLIGELIINRNRYTLLARQLEEKVDVNLVAQNLTETTYGMARISDDLQDTIMKVRMVPVSSVFSRFPRLVRDLSRKSGKEVELVMEGEETELDKSVVEVIGDPLVHLIRNSVDHGIEDADVRVAKGKSAKGKVCLRAFHKGNSVAIEVEDDGKGIDPEKMREVAIRKGIISPEDARALDDREAMELIFAPGFSSAEVITDISGRGVGMDVVRTNIKSLKGSITISSEVGKGTRFTLLLPLTLAIIDALMVNVAGDMYAIPLDAVSETTKIEARRLTDVKGRKAVTLRGEVLGILSLAELLGLPNNSAGQDVLSVVVIHDNDRRLGLVVDRLLERQEIVIKPLSAYLGDLKGISGATIMGDGSVILILDPHEIYMMATSKTI
ncbi:two-component system, chemotaxis family, sensor kinase CheA [Desulfovibrio litoralis DSM 11393]|uniref:Chemotaxis protein CheA n=2 Tax=Desulfovibrio litoralis TaxID=466107 RepID=A0A1M7RSZ3_9BACT|nr:two-component system, chemotaxis family, sensor kinase CheA [Desulfovibrio litoralis DSM 11393]